MIVDTANRSAKQRACDGELLKLDHCVPMKLVLPKGTQSSLGVVCCEDQWIFGGQNWCYFTICTVNFWLPAELADG